MAHMEEYKPLVHDDGPSRSDHDHDSEAEGSRRSEDSFLSDVDLEKIPEEARPKWFQWKLPSRFEVRPNWKMPSTWTKDDVSTLLLLILSYFVAALPGFLQPGGLRNKKELHPTAYLDALRGWAAFSVARYHSFVNKTWFLEYPVIRMVLNGRAMVDIFFVISGYALSYRMLKMTRNQQPGLLKALASSTYRRWWRLYISTGFASLVTALLAYMGWCQGRHHKDTILLQLWDWFWDFGYSSNPFGPVSGYWTGGVYRTHYLDQMWTIPVEFRGSMALFWFVAAAAFLGTRGRRVFAGVVIVLCYWWGIIYVALFLYGMLIADFSFDRHPERLSGVRLPRQENAGELPQPKPRQSVSHKIIFVGLALLGMFFMGQPPDGQYDAIWPWPYLQHAIPYWYVTELGEHFWLGIGAAIFVFALDNCRMLQIPFEWGFSQYLGRLSFGLYAMHNTINWVVYMRIVQPWGYAHFGDESYWAGAPGMLFTAIVMLWSADYFTRVDDWVVWAGKWLETKTFIDWKQ